jgi:hypothetical protein
MFAAYLGRLLKLKRLFGQTAAEFIAFGREETAGAANTEASQFVRDLQRAQQVEKALIEHAAALFWHRL